ncbi:MAG: purine-nucleoside phosphorylase [Sphingobacteriales bacterium]|nr:MAG: purine-nucleoside phosphorylase [Sphingobacteriales bacterium]
MSLFDKIEATAAYIRSKQQSLPETGIILGSGLGGLIDVVSKTGEISYSEIPNFPVSTVEGHAGKMVFGTIGNKQVVLMSGRFHYYEGYSMEEVTFPVRVMKALGVKTLIVSNAAGGMNADYMVGDIVIIKDHINLFPEHPLRGKNDERLGVRFQDMSEPYDLTLVEKARTIAAGKGLKVHTGVYVGLQGPTFETRAEYKWLHIIGGDVVGMSTVPEVIVARHGGMRVFAASVVTDLGIREELNTISHEEVLEAANAAAPKLAGLVADLIQDI